MNQQAKSDVILALDFPTAKETYDFLAMFPAEKPFVKIGMELYYAEGPEIVRQVKARGHKIFLDLKLHDIPRTVERAVKAGAVGVGLFRSEFLFMGREAQRLTRLPDEEEQYQAYRRAI